MDSDIHASPPATQHVCELLRRFARLGLNVDNKTEVPALAKLVEAGKHLLRGQAQQAIASADGAPVLVSYAADGTPIQTTFAQKASHSSAKVRRIGRATEEYYIQQAWYVYRDCHGRLRSSVVLSDPLPLTEGKKLPSLLACALQFLEQPRALGHEGVVVYHYAFDRGLYEGLTRVLRQWHMHDAAHRPVSQHIRQMLYYLDWVMATPCALHGAHLAFRWAMSAQTEFQTSEFAKDMHIIVASLRTSSNLIHNALPDFIARHLAPTPLEELDSEADCHDLWVALAVEPEMLQLLVDLRLRWRDGRLLVSDEVPSNEVVSQVFFCLTSLWRFKSYSEGRWVAAGSTCRSLCIGLLTGLEVVASQIIEDPDTSNYHINGWSKMQESHRQFTVQGAMCSFLTENLSLALLEDSRVVRNYAALLQVIEEETAWVNGVGRHVWDTLGSLCGLPGAEVQSRCIRCTHVSAAFARDRILAPALELPWSLAAGDIQQNLDQLAAGERPAEPTSAKVWHLLKMGYNRAALVAGVELFRQISWGVGPCEQQHASASITAKLHPDVGANTLQIRGFIHTMRHLLPARTPEQKAQDQIMAQLNKLQKRSPQKVSGRNLFVKDLFKCLSTRKCVLGPEKFQDAWATVFARHGGRWRTVPESHKRQYERAASLERLDNEEELSASQQELEERLSLSRAREEQKVFDETPPLRLSSCALGEAALQEYQRLFDSGGFDEAVVQALRAKVAQAPAATPPAFMNTLREIQLNLGPARAKQPWLSAVAKNRGFFSHCIFVFSTEHGRKFYSFMYALQSPVEATFCSISHIDDAQDVVDLRGQAWQELAAASNAWNFAVDWGAITPWHQLPQVPEEQISILRESQLLGGGAIVADSELEPLRVVLNLLPEASRATGDAPRAARGPGMSEKAQLVAKYPWMAGLFEADAQVPLRHPPSGLEPTLPLTGKGDEEGDPEEPQTPAVLPEALAEKVLDEAWAELCNTRAAVNQNQEDDFRVVVIGGQFTVKNKGAAFEAFAGQVKRGGAAEQFCRDYNLQLNSRYSSQWYGIDAAQTCAREWCARSQYFFNLFVESGNPVYRFTGADVAGCPLSKEYKDLVGTVTGSQSKRVYAIMDVAPRVG